MLRYRKLGMGDTSGRREFIKDGTLVSPRSQTQGSTQNEEGKCKWQDAGSAHSRGACSSLPPLVDEASGILSIVMARNRAGLKK